LDPEKKQSKNKKSLGSKRILLLQVSIMHLTLRDVRVQKDLKPDLRKKTPANSAEELPPQAP